jgi:hypothetical protein
MRSGWRPAHASVLPTRLGGRLRAGCPDFPTSTIFPTSTMAAAA